MKKVLLLLLLSLPLFAQAQVTKGSKFLGGNISYTFLKYDSPNQPGDHYLNLDIYNGKFVSNSVALGPIFSMESRWNQNYNPFTNLYDRTNSNSFLGGMFVRKYFELSEKFFFALEGSLAAGIGRNSNLPDSETLFNYQVAFTPMFTFQPVPKWAFLARVGKVSIQDRATSISLTHLNLNLGQVSFGVNYFLNQEKSRK